jgi:hypothetical protein
MIEFVTTSFRLLRTMASAWRRDPEFRSLLVLTVITLLQRHHAHDREPGRPLAQDRNWQDLHDNIHLRRSQHDFRVHRRRVERNPGPQEEETAAQ